jgi:hypothetical protein
MFPVDLGVCWSDPQTLISRVRCFEDASWY